MESSYLAERRSDNQGNDLFESLVFDEEYLILFRQLFFDARANVISALSAYLKDFIYTPEYYDSQNATTDVDFIIQLSMPDTYLLAMNQPASSKMKEYLVSYILYRWLMNKSPNDANIYLQQSEGYMADLKRYLEMRTLPLRRTGRNF
jgi:hypothetical protein